MRPIICGLLCFLLAAHQATSGIIVIRRAPAAGGGDITSNLLIRWQFEEGTGTAVDDSGSRGTDGTFEGGATWPTGHTGSFAVGLDGTDDYVNTSDATVLNASSAFTVAAWVRSTTLAGGGPNSLRNIVIRDQVTGAGAIVFVMRATASGHASPSRYEFTAGGAAEIASVTANNSVVVDTWQHVVGTYDGANVKIYLNGALIDTDAKTGATGTGTGILQAGRQPSGGDDRFWQGQIDEIRVYDRALVLADVQALYAF